MARNSRASGRDTRKVFVVHGRNLHARDAMFAFLRALGLDPIEWDADTAEAKEPNRFIGDILVDAMKSAQAVIVLLSGDDEARLRGVFRSQRESNKLLPQPRQNVLLEAGLAWAMHPGRVILLRIEPVQIASDLDGRWIPRFTGSHDDRSMLRDKLATMCDVKRAGQDWLKAGDFATAVETASGAASATPTSPSAVAPKLSTPGPELVVDATHGPYYRIADAIHDAPNLAIIQVRPGSYNETIVVSKALKIVGDGNKTTIFLQTDGRPAVVFDAEEGHMSNLTVQSTNNTDNATINIGRGRLLLENCDISGDSREGVLIQGGADPWLANNEIHDLSGVGVMISGQSLGTLDGNKIYANAGSGIEISQGSNPRLVENQVYGGKSFGILVHGGATGTIMRCRVYENKGDNFEVSHEADPNVEDCEIYNGDDAGIWIHDTGRGQFHGNRIYGNNRPGVEITTHSDPNFYGNKITGGKSDGVWIHDGGQGSFKHNEISMNKGNGVEVKSGAIPSLTSNTIRKNRVFGVAVRSRGGGNFEGNLFQGNGQGAWSISVGAHPTLLRRNNTEK